MRYPLVSSRHLARTRPLVPHQLLATRCLAFSTSPATMTDGKITDGNLRNTLGHNDTWKYPLFSSDRVRERKSVFLAHTSTLTSVSELSEFIDHLTSLPVLKRATHCMYAYRIILEPNNLSVKILGQNDGGEKGSGERLSRLLDALECQNVVVVVSRWYGGVPLGSDRWKMISSVAKEALHKGGFVKQRNVDIPAASSSKQNIRRKKKK